jgi:Kdo2-lipid IVA lauroyltransferase/acyltransferase
MSKSIATETDHLTVKLPPATGEEPPPPVPGWLRVLALLPLPLLYAITALLTWIFRYGVRFRLGIARANVAACFPAATPRERARIVNGHYRFMGEMVAEVIHGARMPAAEYARRVRVRNPGLLQGLLAQGKPVLVVGAHLANWEWLGNALAVQLGWPIDVGYKPIRSPWAERAVFALRGRFGVHLVPAKQLLTDLMKRRHIVRAVSLIGDQAPTTSDHQHWMEFLGRDTAFYMGAEQMARATRYPALFLAMRRVARGHYEIEFLPLSLPGETLEPGELTTRYARFVEAEILRAPTDWTWGHRRWKLQRKQGVG